MSQQYFVLGAGSIGRRHHLNLQSLGAESQLLAWRDQDLSSLEARLHAAGAAAVVIATATPIRLEIISLCARLGVPFYVEKPLAYRIEALDQIFHISAPVAERSVVGLMMRYHPAVQAQVEAARAVYGFEMEIGHDVRQWRQNWSFADSYAAKPEGGGVLLDLCHEIDIAHCLFPDIGIVSVDCVGHQGFPGVDFATRVTMAAEGGPVGSVAMDYLSPKSIRRMHLSGRAEVVDLDLIACREVSSQGADETVRTWEFDRNEMFLGLMRDFMALAEGQETSGNPLLPRLDRMYQSAALIAGAWEARDFHGTIKGTFA
jgi:predicted dehydrogenase